MEPQRRLEYGICQVHKEDQPVGLGFAIGDQLVATCAHVVNSALGRDKRDPTRPQPDESVSLTFPIGHDGVEDASRSGRVIAWLPGRSAAFETDDIAVLQLEQAVPSHVPVLHPGSDQRHMQVQMWGPQPGHPAGGHVVGTLMGEVIGGRIQIDVNGGGFRVRSGFSGGPIWDNNDNVVGVLAASSRGSEGDAYGLSSIKVAQAWPGWDKADQPNPVPLVTCTDQTIDPSPGADESHLSIHSVPRAATPDQPAGPRLSIDPDPDNKPKPIRAVTSHPNGQLIAAANGTNSAVAYDISGDYHTVAFVIRETPTLAAPRIELNDIAFSSDGTVLVTAAGCARSIIDTRLTGTVKIRRTKDQDVAASVTHQRPVMAAAITSNATLAFLSDDKTVSTHDLKTEKTRLLPHSSVTAMAFSLEKNPRLATGGADKSARIWDATSGQSLQRCPHDDVVTSVAFSPDGRWLATGCTDGRARIWSPSGAQILQFPHNGAVTAVAFSSDGSWLGSAGEDDTARLWDLQTGRLAMECAHPDSVTSLTFGKNQDTGTSWLGTGCKDGSIRIWDIPEVDCST